MIAEYVAVAGAPLPSTPWPLVLMMAQRAVQFEARRQLSMLDATSAAISAAFGADLSAEHDRLKAIAYPDHDTTPAFHPNLFAEDSDG